MIRPPGRTTVGLGKFLPTLISYRVLGDMRMGRAKDSARVVCCEYEKDAVGRVVVQT